MWVAGYGRLWVIEDNQYELQEADNNNVDIDVDVKRDHKGDHKEDHKDHEDDEDNDKDNNARCKQQWKAMVEE